MFLKIERKAVNTEMEDLHELLELHTHVYQNPQSTRSTIFRTEKSMMEK